jgi:hypothetical protein
MVGEEGAASSGELGGREEAGIKHRDNHPVAGPDILIIIHSHTLAVLILSHYFLSLFTLSKYLSLYLSFYLFSLPRSLYVTHTHIQTQIHCFVARRAPSRSILRGTCLCFILPEASYQKHSTPKAPKPTPRPEALAYLVVAMCTNPLS